MGGHSRGEGPEEVAAQRAKRTSTDPSQQGRSPVDPHPLLRLQRLAGNRTVSDLVSRKPEDQTIRRFAVPAEFSFAAQKRAALPLSLELTPIKTGQERHHIISDRHILNYLDKTRKPGKTENLSKIPMNAWVQAALGKEIERATALLAEREKEKAEMSEEEKRKFTQQQARLGEYTKMESDFNVREEDDPILTEGQVEDLLPILEWMPPNLIIDKQVRRFDPADDFDIEAAILHSDTGARSQLVAIAIAINDIPDPVIKKLTNAFRGTVQEASWEDLVKKGMGARDNPEEVSRMLAALQTMPEGMTNRRAGKEMSPSRTGTKEKLTSKPAKGKTSWEELILKLLPPKRS